MTGFALLAEFPLGTYRAHLGDGDIDEVPSVARLHSAFLSAAAAGASANVKGDELTPDKAALAALEWIENHPPDAMSLPERVINGGNAVAHRDLGIYASHDQNILRRRLPRIATESVALAGSIAWIWEEDPPTDVRATLERLCPDVSHLGSAESPVRLRVGEAQASHRRDDNADLFTGRGIDLSRPFAGRTAELQSEYANSHRTPKGGTDRFVKSEGEITSLASQVCIGAARFSPVSVSGLLSPWPSVIMVPLDVDIEPAWRVRWAVRAHRALVALVGDGAPALLTGSYPEGTSRPANHVAIQFLGPQTLASRVLDAPTTLAVLLPADATAADLGLVARAAEQLLVLNGPGGRRARRIGKPYEMAADTFWPVPPAGHTRRWLTVPAAVPDTRPPRRDNWSMQDAIALSVGLVFRDALDVDVRAPRWQVALASAAHERGASAEYVRMLTSGDPTCYVHRVNPGSVVRPYRAVLDLGELSSPQALIAIGQSRHLGAGLLCPIDVAEATRDTQ